jgi:class 3 adenylate cyclase
LGNAPEQHRWTLRFVEPEVEARYREERAPLARRRLRTLVPPLMLLWFGATWFDITAPAEMGNRNYYFRYGIGVPVFATLLTFLWAASDQRFARHWQKLLAVGHLALLVACGCLTAVAVGPFRPHGVIGFVIVLVIGGAIGLLDLRYLVAVALLGGSVELGVILFDTDNSAFDLRAYITWVVVTQVAVVLLGVQLDSFQRRLFVQRLQTERERARAETLLLNVMPKPIADRLKQDPDAIADHFEGVTVVFADIAGFTRMATQMSAVDLVARLDQIFSRLDDIVHRHGLEKIKTIGDQYMAVAGAPTPRADHAEAAARVALEICAVGRELGPGMTFRVGLASGPAVAGVIGKSRFSYDLWGDTVNLASRMESHGVPGKIQVDEQTGRILEPHFVLEDRGVIDVKGKGEVHTYFLVGEAN